MEKEKIEGIVAAAQKVLEVWEPMQWNLRAQGEVLVEIMAERHKKLTPATLKEIFDHSSETQKAYALMPHNQNNPGAVLVHPFLDGPKKRFGEVSSSVDLLEIYKDNPESHEQHLEYTNILLEALYTAHYQLEEMVPNYRRLSGNDPAFSAFLDTYEQQIMPAVESAIADVENALDYPPERYALLWQKAYEERMRGGEHISLLPASVDLS